MTDVLERSLYEEDFYAWTQVQAAALRQLAEQRANLPLDLENLAEEVEDLGKSERDTVLSLAEEVMQHLLLIEYAPTRRSRAHWMGEVDRFRGQIERKITATIRRQLEDALDTEYARARRAIARKMERYGESEAARKLPENRPYTPEQVLGDWMPDMSGQ